MKKIFFTIALCALTMAVQATTYNYLCAITDLKVDTLASNSKNQFTLEWTQKCKNTAEYNSKPTTTYTTTVKLVINSDDRTLEGTYTTEGASPTSSSANVNDQTINLVTSELYYGSTRRLLRTDSISTFTIIKVDESHYGISIGRLCFTAAAMADRGKNTYNYNYCYAEEEILEQGIEPKPYIFSYDGEFHEAVHNYDMTVNGISVIRDDSDYGTTRYFLTLNCSGKNRENNSERDYEVQLAIYPSSETIPGSYATQGSGHLLFASNSYVKDLKVNKTRYLANDSLSTILIQSKGENLYSFFGGTLTCTDIDANYMAVYGKKRIEAVHYYHFSDNDGQGIEFGWDEDNKEMELSPYKVTVEPFTTGGEIDYFNVLVNAKDEKNLEYEVSLTLENKQLDGSFSIANEKLSLWSSVNHGSNSSYVVNGSIITINPKAGNTHTLSGNLLCENEYTYIIKAFDFEYQVNGAEGIDEVSSQMSDVRSQKMLREGVLMIERNGVLYDAQGAMVK